MPSSTGRPSGKQIPAIPHTGACIPRLVGVRRYTSLHGQLRLDRRPPDVRHLRGRRAAPGDLRAVVDAQLAALDHRGPDARGSFAGDHAVIGQNRLAIIDLVTGDPPITNEDGTRRASCSTARSTTSASCASELRGAGHELRSRGRHRGDRPPRRGARAGRARPPARRHVRLRGLGRAPRAPRARPRPGRARSRSTTGAAAGGSCSAARSRRCSPTRRCRGGSTPGAIPAYLTFGYVPDAAHVLRGHPQPPARARAHLRARRRAA